mgnify:CR=1 FL=1
MKDAPRAGQLPVPEQGEALARALAEVAGGTAVAVLMYGSHLNDSSPGSGSAYDLVVVVEEYGAFHRALKERGEIHRPLVLFDTLAVVLPPNVIAFTPDEGRSGMAKCLVIRRDHFENALHARPRDHFLLGRMIQKVALVWHAGAEVEAWVQRCLDRARMGIPVWMAPFVDGSFDIDAFGRRTLEVCYRTEIRPEAGNRSQAIYEAQREHFRGVLPPVLDQAVEQGLLEVVQEGRYRYAHPTSRSERLYWRWHLVRSKLRTTTRWLKHVLTFDNWLPYIVRKVERRTGQTVELTRLERRWPIVFLWPRLFRVLKNRPERE